MIAVCAVSKGYGQNLLFDSVDFKINNGEKIGLVGKNGHGKSTLLKLISGEELPDQGEIIVPKGYRVARLSQLFEFGNGSVLDEVASHLPYNETDDLWKAEKVLSGLGFAQEAIRRKPEEFSSGFQIRINLASVLVSEPDFLMLDEPTNYLDITSIRWLKEFLKKWKKELLLITHDRSFMDSVVTHTIGIHRKKIRKIEGDTSKLYEQIAIEEEIYEKTRLNEEKKKKEVEQFINRFRAKARLAGMVQSRVKALNKMESKNRLERIENLDFSFAECSFSSRHVMNVENLSFSYGDTSIIENLSFILNKGEKLAIIGANGRGKTTLVKLLSGHLSSASGEISVNPNVNSSVYIQEFIDNLNPENTVADEVSYANTDLDRTNVRSICGAMLFPGDDALKQIAVLSGGERSRVMLAKLLATPSNLLFLDEPTNHLDMDSCDALISAIDNFSGAVVMVTHNEMLLDAVADRLIVFLRENELFVFDGSYAEFLEKIGWDEEKKDKSLEKQSGTDRKNIKRERAKIVQEKSSKVKPMKKKIEKIEEEIMELEEKEVSYNEMMMDASGKNDIDTITSVSMKLGKIHKRIDMLFVELEKESKNLDELETFYDARFMNL